MAKRKFSKIFEKKLLARFTGSKNVHIINGLLSGYKSENKEKVISLLEEDFQYSKNRITRKISLIEALIEEIKKDIKEVIDINLLLKRLEK